VEIADGVIARRFSAIDPVEAITDLLHLAYAEHAARGLRFLAAHQSSRVTAQRIRRGECWVAHAHETLVATVVLYGPKSTSGSPWYDRPDVASFGQFAVHPAWRGRGIGDGLLQLIEKRARDFGAAHLALDTAEPALDLRAYYERRGYRLIEGAQWDCVNYASVILSKPLD
jgi:GNAT superfamily N-acetyltransferase